MASDTSLLIPPSAAGVSTVFMFPGQSSADPGMLLRALTLGDAAASVLDRAVSVLGSERLARYTSASGARLESNQDVQISVFLASQMHLRALETAGIAADRSLGLSLGEYSHLVHIGALAFDDALALVERRGAAYDQSPPGIMVAVLGAVEDEVAEAVVRASAQGTVVISNYNAPTQHVIAGERAAVEAAVLVLEEEFGATTVETEGRVPMHSPMLAPVARSFRAELARAPFRTPSRPYISNVSGGVEADPAREVLVDRLTAHVTEPVRWRSAIEQLATTGAGACFVEVGPGGVLFNMLSRRWLDVKRAKTDDREAASLDTQFHQTVRSLRGER